VEDPVGEVDDAHEAEHDRQPEGDEDEDAAVHQTDEQLRVPDLERVAEERQSAARLVRERADPGRRTGPVIGWPPARASHPRRVWGPPARARGGPPDATRSSTVEPFTNEPGGEARGPRSRRGAGGGVPGPGAARWRREGTSGARGTSATPHPP